MMTDGGEEAVNDEETAYIPRREFQDELLEIEGRLIRMGQRVEIAVRDAVDALKDKDIEAARRVIEGDEKINQEELEIESTCLELLALQQPMARDLRLLGVMLKAVTDLERIGDHARDIARVCLRLEGKPLIKPLVDIPRMSDIVCDMIAEGLKALAQRDPEAAREMAERDHEVDRLYGQVFRELVSYGDSKEDDQGQSTDLLMAAASLERIGDHATNLAEWVIFLVTSERVDLNK